MAKTADIGAKRLISLAPEVWARWLTGDGALEVLDLLSAEFQWIGRTSDALVKVHSARAGTFLVANEIQFRPDRRMSLRMRAYAALAEERYDLPVYPAVVNILPPRSPMDISSHYHAEFMGLIAHQDFRVINLWEQDVALVFERGLTSFLPFVPILKGGESRRMVSRAVEQLRADPNIAELEPLLAFFASFVLESKVVRQIMRWDMTILRESPWYEEIFQEGLEQGMEQGLERGLEQGLERGQANALLRVLERRFGALPADLVVRIRRLPGEQILPIVDVALEAPSLTAVIDYLETLPTNKTGENE